jgi:signal transduction histidine kinase
MRWRLWTHPFGSFVFLWMGLALFALTVLLVTGAAASHERNRRVAHSLAVLQHLERFQSALMQADLRSTKSLVVPNDRDAHVKALEAAQASLSDLATLTADNPQQAIRVKMLQNMTNQIAGGIRARSQSPVITILPLLSNPLSALPIVDTVSEIRDEERRLLFARERKRELANASFWTLVSITVALNLLLIWWSYHASRRYIRERNEKQREIEVLNRLLASQLGEIRDLNATLEERIHDKCAELELIVTKLKATNAELERFAFVASHDLQEPLRQIASFNELLSARYSEHLDEKARQYLMYSASGAKRLQLMLQGILQYTIISTTALNWVKINPSELVARVLEDLRVETLEIGAKFEVRVAEGIRIAGDGEMIRTVLRNLLRNALRFHRPGVPPRAEVSIECDDESWSLTVADNGIGVDDRFRNRMFEMFARYHEIGEYAGAGVGLALAKKIIELHGGALTSAANPSGEGTVLTVSVPVDPDRDKRLRTQRFSAQTSASIR